jgi:PAS domain S-box-containing protein
MAAPNNQSDIDELRRRIAALEAENASLRADASFGATTIESELALREETRMLEVLNRTGAALAAELDLDKLVQIVTDAGTQLVDAAFGAFFYNVTDASGKHYTLYAVSGVPRDTFDKFPVPRRTGVFAPTFDGTAIVRSDDITRDPRYGHNLPHLGMPQGHLPVRSYLAVPVKSHSNEVLGGLFFGHPEVGIFTQRAERAIVGIAAQAAIAVENAHLLQAVQNSERRFRALIERNADGIAVIDASNNILYLSPAVAGIEGYTDAELIGGNGIDNTHPDDVPLVQAAVRRALENPGVPIPAVWRRRHKNGQWLWLEGVATNLLQDPAVRGIVTNYRDVTHRVRAEEAQIRSQKMEALGTLAGGIAHDFNNILVAIHGNAKLATDELPAEHPAQRSLAEISRASQRATELVRRILAFSRQTESQREAIHLAAVVREAMDLMRATLPAMIDISVRVTDNLPMVMADPTQIHQIVMNLATNAAHAILDGQGTIEVGVEAAIVTPELIASARELRPGHYVCITVSDTGCGMDSTTMQRIFDPFFTTKPVGKGTGLGLSVVHGIMKTHDGAVTVYSQPNKGTTFRLYFPAANAQAAAAAPPPRRLAAGDGERVLYIDDDEAILHLSTRILERLGYRVAGFTNPEEALAVFNERPLEFDVAVTDLSMPGKSGFDVARELRKSRPDLPVLMTSGYVRPEDRIVAQELGIHDFILKPNTVEELGHSLDKVFRELRDAKQK